MTYTDHHTKASPSRWVGGSINGVCHERTKTGSELADIFWADEKPLMTNAMFEAVKVVALALDKMTK